MWIVVIALLTVVVARLLAFDEHRAFMLLDAYTLWILLPAYTVLVAAVCFRRWPLAITATIVVIAHLAWIVPPLTDTVPVSAAARRAPHVRVVTANVRYDNTEHGPLIAELERLRADVLVIQEVTPAWWEAIQRSRLRTAYPHAASDLRDDPGGMAVLSKVPLRRVRVHHAGGWPIITATVELGGRPVQLAGVHVVAPLQTFARNQRAQRAVTAIVRGLPRPRLVLGDFNASPYNRWFEQMLDLGLRDAHQSVGRPFATSWHNARRWLPPLLIDHVFSDPALVALDAAEGTGTGSDHRPVVVDLAVLDHR